ncbi:MAG: CapA family protein [Chloroflexi bacterium]|nr:CapA family protein [Chloroflexota bacterium]
MDKSSDILVIHAVGDCGPRRIEYGEPSESLFARVHQRIKQADISVCQLEYNLSTKGCLQYRAHSTWQGRVHPDNVRSLVFAGFDVVTHAANHCFDYGPESLLETIDVVRRSNMQIIGVGKDIAEARKPAILERKGIRVGFLDYCSVMDVEYEAREGKPGCAPLRVSTYYEAQEYQAGTPPKIVTIALESDVVAMEEDIRQLRKQVDVVVVAMHWGIHLIPGVLAMYQPTVGHRAIDAGADLVIGHHAHLVKGIEVYKGKVIFYSLGNFAQDTPFHLKPPPGVQGLPKVGHSTSADSHYTMMARCVVNQKAIQKVSFIPGWINQKAEPELLVATDPRFAEVTRYLERWCAELGTALVQEGNEVIIRGSTGK